MKFKSTLLAATLAIFTTSAIHADEDYPDDQYIWKGEAQTLKEPVNKKAAKKRHARKKNATPSEPAEGQQAMKPSDSGTQAKEKGGKEGCEETMSC
jgi:hypothetical protein